MLEEADQQEMQTTKDRWDLSTAKDRLRKATSKIYSLSLRDESKFPICALKFFMSEDAIEFRDATNALRKLQKGAGSQSKEGKSV